MSHLEWTFFLLFLEVESFIILFVYNRFYEKEKSICSSLGRGSFPILYCNKEVFVSMSYAGATSANISKSNGNNYRRNESYYGKYFNENMLICPGSSCTIDGLADGLHNAGYLKDVTGIQPFDFQRRFEVVFQDVTARGKLYRESLDINGHHVFFQFHGRNPWYRVQVFNVPIGILIDEIEDAFEEYGEIQHIERRFMVYHGRNMNTGRIMIAFFRIIKNISSNVTVRGWKAYFYYSGQQKMCRDCGETDHLAKDCPKNKRPEETPMDQLSMAEEQNSKADGKPTNMDVQVSWIPNVPESKDVI